MSEQKFANEGELQAWLESKKVPQSEAAKAAPTLFGKDFVYPPMLEGISSEYLRESGLTIPIAQLLSNKLQKGVHQTPQPEPKRQKNFSLLLQQGDFEAAMAELLNAASDHISETPVDPKRYRWPVMQSDHTWNRSNMGDQLREKRELIRNRLMAYTGRPEDRQQVVIGIRLGTGFGKTHLLTDAPDLLAAQGLYVTYNNYQGLSADRKDPVKTILIRLLLAMNNCESTKCDQFLTSGKSGGMMEASSDALRDLFLYHLKSAWGQNYPDIVIGVDELMDLGVEESKRVVKELAEVSARYLSETKSMCTVLVSSLNTATFSTKSGRPVEEWAPDRPDKGTLEYFAHSFAGEDRQRAMALVSAVSGGHIRSMVLAFDLFRQDKVNASVQWLYNKMSSRMGAKIGQNTCSCIQDYVKECISSSGSPKIEPEVEEISDSIGAVPPVFLMMAYKGTSSEVHLENMIHAFSLFEKDGKHLELVSKYYDLFRANLGLPVVPGKTVVRLPLNGNNQKTTTWYEELEFSRNMSENQAALLKQKQTSSKGKTKITVVATEEVPKFGNYYHPKIGNHTWIDRVYVAKHPCNSDPDCLVLVQDKVNESGFADACRKLEEAANSLTKKAGYPKNALLIVNVIGAGDGTRAQSGLTWPSILIRGLDEVRQFYSVNFADMVWFARERHLLSE